MPSGRRTLREEDLERYPPSAGGELHIGTRNIYLDKASAAPHGVAPGWFVQISVPDIGVGMDKETLARIFERFFTTKEMGSGTGLGLASTYGIVITHQGFITVKSSKGEGTTLDVYLPASDKEIPAATERPAEASLTGDVTVLIVDDDERVIEVTTEMLKMRGYVVYAARSGLEAMEIYEKHNGDIGLVILDMIMPVMGGGETYDRLKKMNPYLKAILSSGYSIDGQDQDILNRGCQAFLQKPFIMRTLSEAIRNTLGSKA